MVNGYVVLRARDTHGQLGVHGNACSQEYAFMADQSPSVRTVPNGIEDGAGGYADGSTPPQEDAFQLLQSRMPWPDLAAAIVKHVSFFVKKRKLVSRFVTL
jgi:hypothetical protein